MYYNVDDYAYRSERLSKTVARQGAMEVRPSPKSCTVSGPSAAKLLLSHPQSRALSRDPIPTRAQIGSDSLFLLKKSSMVSVPRKMAVVRKVYSTPPKAIGGVFF